MLAWMDQLSDDQIALLACGGILAVSFFCMFVSTPLRSFFQANAQARMGGMIAGQLPDAAVTSREQQISLRKEKAA